ncbi:putative UPF0157 protein YqkA [Meira miltonrushii]|uniref:Putative UPF0157 protein YqkA n=1 Tax=Meira miltonrushii TaxID=1280837 RepID=A0A316VLE7_9BASI|nr:putative UPF0157 protein YqkA [Meira miltonrushii]PWN38337.1 putative UPF0157 protein YqkA [Meira miltonrushii]
MRIHLEKYNPGRKEEFKVIKGELSEALHDTPILSIEHVGSTSIEGLYAKPVIDIDIIVEKENVQKAINALVAVGYTDLGEMGIHGRVALRQPGYGKEDHATGEASKIVTGTPLNMRRNTYVIEKDCLALKNHIDTKRILEQDESLRQEYINVKQTLASKQVADIAEYANGKNAVLEKVLRRAGWTTEDLYEMRNGIRPSSSSLEDDVEKKN